MAKKAKSASALRSKPSAKVSSGKSTAKAGEKSAGKLAGKLAGKIASAARALAGKVAPAAASAAPAAKKSTKPLKSSSATAKAKPVAAKASSPKAAAAKAAPSKSNSKTATASAKAGASITAVAKSNSGKAGLSTKSAPVTAAIHQATPSALVVAPSKKTAVKTASEAPAPSVLSSAPIEAQEATTDEKSADKKKKKDDLKIDRTGDLEAQWKVIAERFKSLKPVPYKMSENYEARTVLMHKVLGWGFVLTSLNNRLEVLFKDGIKILVSNYKAN